MKSKQSPKRSSRPRTTTSGVRDIARLEDIPNIGPAVAADLRQLGITSPADLRGRDPYAMYDDLCRITGQRHDPCLPRAVCCKEIGCPSGLCQLIPLQTPNDRRSLRLLSKLPHSTRQRGIEHRRKISQVDVRSPWWESGSRQFSLLFFLLVVRRLIRSDERPLSTRRSAVAGPAVHLRIDKSGLGQHLQERPLPNSPGNSV